MSSPKLPQNFGRAFDLSSLKKPAAGTEPTQPGVAIEATPENLVSDFVSYSNTVPVVLLAWSARVPESVQVLQILNKLAANDGGTWRLGSVNLDKYPEMANALQVQALPFGIALIQEQGVPLFDAAHPEPQLRAVLNKVLELATEKGLKISGATPASAPTEPALEAEEVEAMTALEKADYAGAAAAYKKWLFRKPGEKLAQIGLAQCELMLRISGLDSVDIMTKAAAEPNILELQLQAADIEVASGNYESGFNRIIKSIRILDGDDKKRAKEHLLTLFSLVDPMDPILIKARSALASALF